MKKILSLLAIISCCGLLFSSCQKDYSVEKGQTQSATGSLWDSAGNCLPDTVIGTFYNGVTPGSDTAYVEIQVNVTQTGSYNITTGKGENGLVFSDSGFFSNTGLNTIRLKPIGTPILNSPTTFNVSFDSSFCSFTVNVQDSTGTGLGGQQDTTGQGGDPDDFSGNWQFATDSGGFFAGTFDTAVIIKDSTIWGSGGQMLYMGGFTNASTDSAITLIIYLPNGVIAPGTYNNQLNPPANGSLFAFNFTTGNGDPIYEAIPSSSTPIGDVTITISSYDNSTHVVTGTFSGTAEDDAYDGKTIGIVNGNFTATVTQ
jgi:hypothetical protein